MRIILDKSVIIVETSFNYLKNAMIVCVCKNISDNKIIKEIKNGASFEDLQIDLGVCLCCGCCRGCIESLIKEHQPKLETNHQ